MRSTSSPCNSLGMLNPPDLFHFRSGNFLTPSVIIVYSVSGNRLRAHTPAVTAIVRAA